MVQMKDLSIGQIVYEEKEINIRSTVLRSRVNIIILDIDSLRKKVLASYRGEEPRQYTPGEIEKWIET